MGNDHETAPVPAPESTTTHRQDLQHSVLAQVPSSSPRALTVTRRQYLRGSALAGLTGAGAVAVASCGVGQDQDSGTAQRRPVTLRFLTNWAGGARLELLQKTLPEFQRQYPHITVEFEPKNEGMYAMLIANAAAGTLPH